MKRDRLKSLIKKEVREALNEISQTGNVAGYQTPFAFSGKSEEDEEDRKEWMKKVNKQYGYTMVNEATPEALQDFYAYFKNIPGGPNSTGSSDSPNYVGEKGLNDFSQTEPREG